MCNYKTLVILLNWNGSYDTLECCKSLKQVTEIKKREADVFIIDNNSSIEQCDYLKHGLSLEFGEPSLIYNDDELEKKYCIAEVLKYKNYYLLCSKSNHGFAKGCNFGVKYALKNKYQNVLFLNNDTIVESNFLSPLLETLKNSDAVIPQIRYWHDKNLIWNCGGVITTFGSRKYFYAKKNIDKIIFPSSIFPVSFATGCCILFRTEYFHSVGLFSERFFFGEEDIELALRLKKLKAKILCNTTSVIYHKVGASIKGEQEILLRKAYIHYLNRFVNMKLYLGLWWYIWLIPSMLKVLINLLRINKIKLKYSFFVIRKLLVNSLKLSEVNKDTFEQILKCGIK
ncbi:glycosyltransferase family 2 protein [Escherichia albertii]|uniref:glycosyltransferase family 2 protein n=1 Tax=Escherichia albertii TaxID=208962 RepID=UPI0023611A85|nr:glycosyltransferase family 2 protein [Escherichia albertii]WDB75969.1 glycosyltransferase family 2 protein [Escherichia albertii]